jgi:CheY-like chemotaxis protein
MRRRLGKPGTATTLLVVDDEPQNVELLRMIVEDSELPVRFVTATNGAEAVSQVRAASEPARPDLDEPFE